MREFVIKKQEKNIINVFFLHSFIPFKWIRGTWSSLVRCIALPGPVSKSPVAIWFPLNFFFSRKRMNGLNLFYLVHKSKHIKTRSRWWRWGFYVPGSPAKFKGAESWVETDARTSSTAFFYWKLFLLESFFLVNISVTLWAFWLSTFFNFSLKFSQGETRKDRSVSS